MISEVLIPSTSIGYGVSMALSGKSLLGAGTSIYKDISYFTPTCPKYLTSDSMFDSHYLMSYYDSAQDTSTIVLMELSNPRDTTVLASSTFPSEVYDIATLNQQTGIFVAINQDLDETQDTATVIAGCSIPPSFFLIFLCRKGHFDQLTVHIWNSSCLWRSILSRPIHHPSLR
jgi:hypothetical protein